MMPRSLKIELCWFLAVAVMAVALSFCWPKTLQVDNFPELSLTIMDSYFSLTFLKICFFYFTVFGTVISLVRGIISRFKAISINLHFIFFLVLLVVLAVCWEDLIYKLYYSSDVSANGYTIYPPLSALGPNKPKPADPQWMIIPQLTILVSIFILCLKTGKLIDVIYKAKLSK